jgi:hypothetical protein
MSRMAISTETRIALLKLPLVLDLWGQLIRFYCEFTALVLLTFV